MIRIGSAPLTVTAPPLDDDWRASAACTPNDEDLFFAEGHGDHVKFAIADAKAICAACPVITQCRQWALDTRQEHGVYGGIDAAQRRAIRRSKQPPRAMPRGGRKLAECGTRAAWERHRRNGEPIDELCATQGRHSRDRAHRDAA
jgi:WhiB family redox-sensing transcriptional regulator